MNNTMPQSIWIEQATGLCDGPDIYRAKQGDL